MISSALLDGSSSDDDPAFSSDDDAALYSQNDFDKRRRAILAWFYLFGRHERTQPRLPRRMRLSSSGSWFDLHSQYTDTEFKLYYRLTRYQFDKLLRVILERFPEYKGDRTKGAIDVRLKLGSTLRYLAGGIYLDIMRSHSQRRTTFYLHLHETLQCLIHCFEIEFPTDSAELATVEEECCALGQGAGIYRGAIGFIDGIVVKMIKPDADEVRGGNVKDWFVARKGTYGLNLQCICDGKYRFTHISMAYSASSHDSTCWAASKLAQHWKSVRPLEVPYFLCGDSAYAGCPNIITPFRNAKLGTREDNFNFVHSSKRSKIECAFGHLCKRFGVLWRPLAGIFKTKTNILGAIFRLHNFIINNPDPNRSNAPPSSSLNCNGTQPLTDEDVRDDYLLRAEECVDGNIRVSTRTGETARQMRDNIAKACAPGRFCITWRRRGSC